MVHKNSQFACKLCTVFPEGNNTLQCPPRQERQKTASRCYVLPSRGQTLAAWDNSKAAPTYSAMKSMYQGPYAFPHGAWERKQSLCTL